MFVQESIYSYVLVFMNTKVTICLYCNSEDESDKISYTFFIIKVEKNACYYPFYPHYQSNALRSSCDHILFFCLYISLSLIL